MLLARVFAVIIAVNMLVCAILFAPWILPRESFSGLMGRWFETAHGWKHGFACALVPLLDLVCAWERRHCVTTYRQERALRDIMYGGINDD